MDNNRCNETIEVFMRMMGTFNKFSKKPLKFNNDIVLFPSEVNALHMIGHHKDSNITEIALKLNITKGAISQVVHKLEDKGMVSRENTHNQKEVFLQLTELGKEILQEQIKRCSERQCNIKALFKELSNDEFDKVMALFNSFDDLFQSELDK